MLVASPAKVGCVPCTRAVNDSKRQCLETRVGSFSLLCHNGSGLMLSRPFLPKMATATSKRCSLQQIMSMSIAVSAVASCQGFCPRPQMVHVVGVIACCLGVVLGHSFHESRRSHLLVSTLMYTISLQCYRYHLKPALQARCKMRAAKCKEAKTLEV